jgi:SlyX protein
VHDDRLIEIETRIAYQEDALRTLSDALARQQLDLDRLQRLCQSLQSRLEAGGDTVAPASLEEERPPHY